LGGFGSLPGIENRTTCDHLFLHWRWCCCSVLGAIKEA
jgi:hypothetical protein